jgi:short-subunit dehydrogenase
LAKRGHDLIVVARDRERLETLATRLQREFGVKVDVLVADLSREADLSNVEARLRQDSNISMLVNNAGIAGGGSLAGANPQNLNAMINLNVLALTRLAAAAASAFVARRAGTIVNIGSVVALMPENFSAVYLSTKAYVLAFSEALRKELAEAGVRVQAVLPGATRTEIWERAGLDLSKVPESNVMQVDDLVDAALAGLDAGETVTIPSLPDVADWEEFKRARLHLAPNLSRNQPAARYRVGPADR